MGQQCGQGVVLIGAGKGEGSVAVVPAESKPPSQAQPIAPVISLGEV